MPGHAVLDGAAHEFDKRILGPELPELSVELGSQQFEQVGVARDKG
jgi:hypothetical protein